MYQQLLSLNNTPLLLCSVRARRVLIIQSNSHLSPTDMSDAASNSRDAEIEALRNRIAQLEKELKEKPVRKAVEKMEELVVDSNPYRYFLSSLNA